MWGFFFFPALVSQALSVQKMGLPVREPVGQNHCRNQWSLHQSGKRTWMFSEAFGLNSKSPTQVICRGQFISWSTSHTQPVLSYLWTGLDKEEKYKANTFPRFTNCWSQAAGQHRTRRSSSTPIFKKCPNPSSELELCYFWYSPNRNSIACQLLSMLLNLLSQYNISNAFNIPKIKKQ